MENIEESEKEAKEPQPEPINVDELKREVEEAKERVKRDVEEVRDIIKRIAEEAGGMGKAKVEEAMQQAERRIAETAQRVERRIEKAVGAMTKSATGAGSVVTRELDFSDFTNVEVSHAFKVEITRSDSYSVSITANETLFDYIDVTKSGNTLKISRKAHDFPWSTSVEARITMPTLNKLRLSGATKGLARGFSSQEDFDLNLSGASTLDIEMEAGKTKLEISGASRLSGSLKVGDAEFTLSGAGRAALSGSANNVVLSAWGASKLDLPDFTLNDTSVQLKGASKATCGQCCGNLDLDLSGASRLEYGGNPTIRDIKVSGASTLRRR